MAGYVTYLWMGAQRCLKAITLHQGHQQTLLRKWFRRVILSKTKAVSLQLLLSKYILAELRRSQVSDRTASSS